MKAAKAFRYAHAGHTVCSYRPGDELPADAAAWAIANGYACLSRQAETEKKKSRDKKQ